MLRLSDEEVKELMRNRGMVTDEEEKPKKSKYHNTRVEFEGLKFDSKHEAEVYANLMLLKRGGAVRAVARQVKFDLPGDIKYIADFVVIYPDNHCEVWDAKSLITKQNRVYINKKKQMKALWGLDIKEV